MNEFLLLFEEVRNKLKSAIEKWALYVEKGQSDKILLGNSSCQIELENIDNKYVSFKFSQNRGHRDSPFLLTHYLDTVDEGLASKLLPLPPYEWDEEKRIDYYLDKYNEILLNHFERPLIGDFAWISKLDQIESENKELVNLIVAELRRGNPKASEANSKRRSGDPTWKTAARALKQ